MEQKLSEKISIFLTLMGQVQKDYAWSGEQVHRMEQLTQDYLHMLELSENSYHEKARIAGAISECRAERRRHKDDRAVLEPLIAFLESDKGKVMITQLQQVLGAVRKAERAGQERNYIHRVLTQDQYDSKQVSHCD